MTAGDLLWFTEYCWEAFVNLAPIYRYFRDCYRDDQRRIFIELPEEPLNGAFKKAWN